MHKNKMAWFCKITLLIQIALLCCGDGIPLDGHPFDCWHSTPCPLANHYQPASLQEALASVGGLAANGSFDKMIARFM
jgi:hypothetical protein